MKANNTEALREALDQCRRDHWFVMAPDTRQKVFSALSAPARNCDRFATVDDAWMAFCSERIGAISDWYKEFGKWLFAEAQNE